MNENPSIVGLKAQALVDELKAVGAIPRKDATVRVKLNEDTTVRLAVHEALAQRVTTEVTVWRYARTKESQDTRPKET